MPGARYLRKMYIPLLKKEYDLKLKEKLKGRKIAVLCDETTNRQGQAVFLTLFKLLPSEEEPLPSIFVASVKILENVNGDQCSKAILKVCVFYSNLIATSFTIFNWFFFLSLTFLLISDFG